MKIRRFGLGIRFDFLSEMLDDSMAKRMFEEVFSVLTLSDVKGLNVYGGVEKKADAADENIYMIVFTGGSLNTMRRIYHKIADDAAIDMYLCHNRPFIETNRLVKVEGLTFFGEVERNGGFSGGIGSCFGLTVPKKHGKKRPVGKGIKILLAPDSFKGTLSSTDAIKRLTLAARRHFQGIKIVPVPIADGGEGTVKALVTACDGAMRNAKVHDPLGRQVQAHYGVLHGKTAVIEMAEASGLTLVDETERDIMDASTVGTGELIRRALDEGLRSIVIGLGGSATNDCGMGCARSLGAKFYDADDNELMGCGGDLIKTERIDLEYLNPALMEADITIMCDVTNPLLGDNGAARIYSPQKGASEVQIAELEAGAAHFVELLEKVAGREVKNMAGAGAAGGLGAMLLAISDAVIESGIDAMLKAVEFKRLLKGVALVVTGEGRLDAQSVRYGKAVAGIMKICTKRNVPVAVLTGSMGDGAEEIYSLGNAGIMTTINAPMSDKEAIEDCERLFDDAADRMFRFIRMGRDVEKIGAPKKERKFGNPIVRLKQWRESAAQEEKKAKKTSADKVQG